MRASAGVKLAALLLLALLAPLQSVLAVACAPAPQGTHAPCPDHQRHERGGAAQHLCGCCCVIAMNAISHQFDVPRSPAPTLTLPAQHAPHEIARDRLDRPPR
jgi:hypothetical protein